MLLRSVRVDFQPIKKHRLVSIYCVVTSYDGGVTIISVKNSSFSITFQYRRSEIFSVD